jgi:hypothetical protein
MAATPLEALVSGLALGGVLAVAAAWSRAVRRSAIPHLGVGAVAGVGIMLANRLSGTAVLGVAVAVLLAGAAAGGLAGLADRSGRLAERSDRWTEGRPVPPLLVDMAVLGGLVALTAALRPPLAIPVPFGPLGGRPATAAGLAALAVGAGGVWLVARARREGLLVWWLAGAVTAVAAALAGGALGPAGTALVALPTVVDAVGLAFRAAAAALLGRNNPLHAGLAGLVLGVAEGLLWLVTPAGLGAALPAVVAAAVGVWALRVPLRRLEALGP